MFRTSMPDMTMTVHDIVAEGDKVATRVSWRSTNRGEMMGIPSGMQLEVIEMHFYRFSPTSGKIVERWGEWDMMGMTPGMPSS
jgi:predicted ester cyclase